jgi:SEC-C motif
VDIQQVAETEDLESEADEDAAVNATQAELGIASSASADTEAEGPDEDGDEVTRDEDGNPVIVGPAPVSHAEGKVPASKQPKSEELKTPWADGRTFPGTGKNAPCPCGSGRKYKMCHGQNEQ